MLIFLDTEFSDLYEPYLISIGLVSLDGRELYLECAGISYAICSDFVRAAVLPHLNGKCSTPVQISDRISDFLLPYGFDITFFSDAPKYDVELIKPFIPAKVPLNYVVPSFDDEQDERKYRLCIEHAYAHGLRRHHALDDARANAFAWKTVNSPGKYLKGI